MEKFDVLLVSMPWAPPREPSIGLGILKECLSTKNIKSKVFHAAPHLLKWISVETYDLIAKTWGVNEFLFTYLLDPQCDEVQLLTLAKQLDLQLLQSSQRKFNSIEILSNLLIKIRDEVIPIFLEYCAKRILEYAPSIVGFTCMFDQTIASLALAKVIKEHNPSITIIFGGYALEGSAAKSIASSFSQVDLIVLGDGEDVIVQLAEKILDGKVDELQNKIIKAAKIDMANSPIPDYYDWFEELDSLYNTDKIKVKTQVLPVESSRGCWWGQIKHCVFCGIDEDTLKYRHKSADAVLDMLEELRKRHGLNFTYRFSDYIMPKNFYSDLLPRLVNKIPKYQLHSEIKANHPSERIKLLSEAGFLEIQPGIESFSTGVLKAMDKGVRGIDNVSLLKNGYINKVSICYNFLYGLPSDTLTDYETIVEKIPSIYHLTPPIARTKTIITKFSPLQMNPERFGISSKAIHHSCYDIIFSQGFLKDSSFNLDDYAYYFERNFEYKADLEILYFQIVKQIDHWKGIHRERDVELSYSYLSEGLMEIVDTRFNVENTYILNGLVAKTLAIICEEMTNKKKIYEKIIKLEMNTAVNLIESTIEFLNEKRLLWIEGELILGLPIPRETVDRYKENNWTKSWPAIYA